jgi:hypothetical protein
MAELKKDNVERYLRSLFGKPVTILSLSRLGEAPSDQSAKAYGYGSPVHVEYEISGQRSSAVIHTMRPGHFGHEHMADRAQVLLWEHATFNRLPRHLRSLDVGGFTPDSSLVSLGDVEEIFHLTEFAEGTDYYHDLARLGQGGDATELDLARVDALCDYLVDIHRVPGPDPALYVRRIRELVGHGECIMGVIDSYPSDLEFPTPQMLEEIEHLCVAWRWRLRNSSHRLRQIHGDFHPWNILFSSGTDFRVLDRSRGEYGDPADDVASLTLNYAFSSLQQSGRLDGPLAVLFERFWRRYLDASGDREILDVIAPFYAFRGLVMASPVWYPSLPLSIRRKLFSFIRAVLEAKRFDPEQFNDYCGC